MAKTHTTKCNCEETESLGSPLIYIVNMANVVIMNKAHWTTAKMHLVIAISFTPVSFTIKAIRNNSLNVHYLLVLEHSVFWSSIVHLSNYLSTNPPFIHQWRLYSLVVKKRDLWQGYYFFFKDSFCLFERQLQRKGER